MAAPARRKTPSTAPMLEKTSIGTKTNTPIMETPLNVQSVSQQVLRDQQITDLAQALKTSAA